MDNDLERKQALTLIEDKPSVIRKGKSPKEALSTFDHQDLLTNDRFQEYLDHDGRYYYELMLLD